MNVGLLAEQFGQELAYLANTVDPDAVQLLTLMARRSIEATVMEARYKRQMASYDGRQHARSLAQLDDLFTLARLGERTSIDSLPPHNANRSAWDLERTPVVSADQLFVWITRRTVWILRDDFQREGMIPWMN